MANSASTPRPRSNPPIRRQATIKPSSPPGPDDKIQRLHQTRGASQQSIEIAGQRISYLESPAEHDAPVVVFVHGHVSSAKTWLPVIDGEFGGRFRCLALGLPGHGDSEPAKDAADYSRPGHAAVVTAFVRELGVSDAVFVGWGLGGHVLLEAVAALPDARGFVPNPAMGVLFSADVSEADATMAAEAFTAPGSSLDVGEFVSDILAADGAARAGTGASTGDGRFADGIAIVAALRQPVAAGEKA